MVDLINATLRSLEKEHVAAEPKHLAALLSVAERAYRRPLTANERADILAYYKKLRSENHVSHEDAVRDSLVSILMSPDFLYRFDLATRTIRLHDVIQSYLQQAVGDGLPAFHAHLLDAYTLTRWADLPPEEPYLWDHLAGHLAAATSPPAGPPPADPSHPGRS